MLYTQTPPFPIVSHRLHHLCMLFAWPLQEVVIATPLGHGFPGGGAGGLHLVVPCTCHTSRAQVGLLSM